MSDPMVRLRRRELAAIAVASLAVGVGIGLTRGPSLEDLDGANFFLALDEYDIARHQPHFPGYPVYLVLCGALDGLGLDRVLALQLPGIGAWTAALAMFQPAVARHTDTRTGWLAWLLLALAPLGWLTAGRTGSDTLGLGLSLIAACALAIGWRKADQRFADPRWVGLAGLVAGLAIGARPALAPWVLGLALVALRSGDPFSFGLGLVGGTVIWAVPFWLYTGDALMEHGRSFVVGHFTRWGGAATVEGADGLGTRAWQFTSLFARYGLGLPIVGTEPMRWIAAVLWLAGLGRGLGVLPRRSLVALLAVAVPFALWLWVGQNPEKPRHVLPLLPMAAVVAAAGLAGGNDRALALGFFGLGAVTIRLAAIHHAVPSPEAQLAQWLTETRSSDEVRLFTGQSERVLVALAPGYRVEYAVGAAERDRRLSRAPPPPTLLWTDAVSDQSPPGYGPPQALIRLSRDPAIDPHRPELTVFTASPSER